MEIANSTPRCIASRSGQIRLGGPGSVYYQRRRGNGDTTMEAMRALKRRLVRVVYGLLHTVESSGTVTEAA